MPPRSSAPTTSSRCCGPPSRPVSRLRISQGLVRWIKTRQSPSASAAAAANRMLPARGLHRIPARQDPHAGIRQARVHQRRDRQPHAVARLARAVASLSQGDARCSKPYRPPRTTAGHAEAAGASPRVSGGDISTLDAAALDPILTMPVHRSSRRRRLASGSASLGQKGRARAARCSGDEHLSAYARYGLEPIDDPSADDALVPR